MAVVYRGTAYPLVRMLPAKRGTSDTIEGHELLTALLARAAPPDECCRGWPRLYRPGVVLPARRLWSYGVCSRATYRPGPSKR
jgi:hypothetical protein